MTTTPTLRDAAQAVLKRWDACNNWRDMYAAHEDFEALRAALAAPADALAEPVAKIVKFGEDGKEVAWAKGRMPEIGATLHTATQLQQAVARALDEVADFVCSGPPPAKIEGGHIEIGKRARRAYAAAIRAKGQQT